MSCLECLGNERKYKCPRCNHYWWAYLFSLHENFNKIWIGNSSCSFGCFKKHRNVDCAPEKSEKVEHDGTDKSHEFKKTILHFTTEDTLDPEKLSLLGINFGFRLLIRWTKIKLLIFTDYQTGKSEALKDLLRNAHLREFLRAVDSSQNAHKAMKFAMLEPLFVEFADECMKIVEPDESTNTWSQQQNTRICIS